MDAVNREAKSLVLTPLDEGFEKHLIEYGCFPHNFAHRDGQGMPANWEELQQVIRPQGHDSKTTLASDDVARIHRHDRGDFSGELLRVLEEGDEDFARSVRFDRLKPLTDGSLIAAEPTLYNGAKIGQLSKQACEALEPYIVPSRAKENPILPNFFMEPWPSCSHYRVGMRQSLYIGCMGARAMQVLQSYGKPDPIFDGNAYTIVVTYYDEVLKLYSLHPMKSVESGPPVQYHMTRLASFAIGNVETLRAALTAYRNLRDWTKGKRDEFIKAANGRVIILAFSPVKSLEYLVIRSAWLIYAIGH
jgi:hypothetical protein